MTYCKVSPAERLFHGAVALNIWIGIFLTGFGCVHGWLRIPGVFRVAPAGTGFCTGMDIPRRLFPAKPPVGQ